MRKCNQDFLVYGLADINGKHFPCNPPNSGFNSVLWLSPSIPIPTLKSVGYAKWASEDGSLCGLFPFVYVNSPKLNPLDGHPNSVQLWPNAWKLRNAWLTFGERKMDQASTLWPWLSSLAPMKRTGDEHDTKWPWPWDHVLAIRCLLSHYVRWMSKKEHAASRSAGQCGPFAKSSQYWQVENRCWL